MLFWDKQPVPPRATTSGCSDSFLGMDIEAVRTFVAVTDSGQFQAVADDLGITQQAVSKRVATLERSLGVTLLVRSGRGVHLSVDGQVFLPHARELVRAAERAVDSVRQGHRTFRVDVLNTRIAPATALRAFHQMCPDIELDIVTLAGASTEAAVTAVLEGGLDATFRVIGSARRLPAPIHAARVIDERHQLLVGPKHPLSDATSLTPADLCAHRVWMPGLRSDTDWGAYYREFSSTFGIGVDTIGPDFGDDVLLEELAGSAELATLIGAASRYRWPESYDMRRIPIVDPAPVYPHSIVWRGDNPHPALVPFIDHLRGQPTMPGRIWLPRAW